VDGCGFAFHVFLDELFDYFVIASFAHVDGDCAGGDGGWHAAGDSGQGDRGVDGESGDVHAFGVPDAPGDGGRALVAGVEQSAEVFVVHVESDSDAHLDASLRMLADADALLTVWDGQPARGHGGTADVVEAARERGIPVTVVWPVGATRD